jgi:proliferating cell nuclear antigen
MYLQTIQASALRTIFEVLKDIVNDVNVYFTPDGVRIQTFDTAKVTLIQMILPAENFEEYTCDAEMIAGLNMTNTHKLLKSVTNNDSLSMRMEGRDVLEIEIENTVKHSKTSFKLKLLDINEDMLNVPDMDMDIVTTIPSTDFQRIARDMANLASEMSIVRHGSKLKLSCLGDFADQTTILECGGTGPAEETGNVYPLKYINMYTKATNLCSSVQLFQFSEPNMPMVFRYAIANLGEIKFYLAQKTEET